MNQPSQTGLSELGQEAPAGIKKNSKSLQIGIPREVDSLEKRVPLKPGSLEVLVRNGHEVIVESGVGQYANFQDLEYSDAGARISYDTKQVFESNTIIKIGSPTADEIGWMKSGSTLISTFPAGNQAKEYLEAINAKKIIALGYEFIQDKVGGLPIMRAMSEIAGSTVMLIAAEFLSSARGGRGEIIGGITGVPPARVVILGAGTVAEFSARAALGLGAEIRVFDNHTYKLRRLKHALGAEVYTSTFDRVVLESEVLEADVLIGAVRMEKGNNKILVTEEMVSMMNAGSVIIDVSIDQGGCIETSKITSHNDPVFTRYDVIHYCVPNIASRVARTASLAISNIFTPIILEAGERGGFEEMIYTEPRLMKGVYSYKGSLTNFDLAKRFNMPYKDMGLFMAARI